MTDLAKRTWPEVEALLQKGCGAILPVGSTEAHGPHLPLDTDVTIALGMARRAAEKLEAEGRPCVVLPPVAYSVTDFAAPFAGTLSLPEATARAHLRDILLAAGRAGFAPLAVANGHLEPAHIGSIATALAEVEAELGRAVVFPDVTRRKLAEQLGDEFKSGACHAGSYESSLVLADDGRSVRDAIRAELPPVEISLVDVIRDGKADFVEGGGTQAYFGFPADASDEEGRVRFATLSDFVADAMRAVWPD